MYMENTTAHNERKDRLRRLSELKKLAINPYPARTDFATLDVHKVLTSFSDFEKNQHVVGVRGRIRSKREHGALLFIDVDDNDAKIQLYIKNETLSHDQFKLVRDLVDVGDFIAAQGTCTKTKRGEQSILVTQVQLLAKSLRPLPEKWHGLQDVETRFRKRELDLLANKEVKSFFIKRNVFIQSFRAYLLKHDCIEVETPVLQPIPGGATARPFVTHHNALDQDMFLRIAPELYLKRLVVGGMSRVFEVARCFRNEGIDTQHNPEFTQIELYIAYFDFEELMSFTEKLLSDAIQKTLGSEKITYQGHQLDFTPPYPRKTFSEVISQYTKIDITTCTDKKSLSAAAKKIGMTIEKSWGEGKILDELFKKYARPHIHGPVFITHHPLTLSPLAKKDIFNERVAERFQLLVEGMEVLNGFSELNDPIDQKNRFDEQEKLRSQGDEEAQYIDTTYVESLEYGLPPTAGVGIGIDRLMQIVTNTNNIKEVILFPTLRNKS